MGRQLDWKRGRQRILPFVKELHLVVLILKCHLYYIYCIYLRLDYMLGK